MSARHDFDSRRSVPEWDVTDRTRVMIFRRKEDRAALRRHGFLPMVHGEVRRA